MPRHDDGGELWIEKAGFPPAASAQPHPILRLQHLGSYGFDDFPGLSSSTQ